MKFMVHQVIAVSIVANLLFLQTQYHFIVYNEAIQTGIAKRPYRWRLSTFGQKDGEDQWHSVKKYVKRVTYTIHQDFKPNVIAIDESPYSLERDGWGTFPFTVQIEFKTDDKPMTFQQDLSFQPKFHSKHLIPLNEMSSKLKSLVQSDHENAETLDELTAEKKARKKVLKKSNTNRLTSGSFAGKGPKRSMEDSTNMDDADMDIVREDTDSPKRLKTEISGPIGLKSIDPFTQMLDELESSISQLDDESCLQIARIIYSKKSENAYIIHDRSEKELIFDLCTFEEPLLKELHEYCSSRIQ